MKSSIFILFAGILLFFVPISADIIKGKVTDENDEPIPAAHVFIPEMRTGASADLDGNWWIEIHDEQMPIGGEKTHFQITAVGYGQRDEYHSIEGDKFFNFVLHSQAVDAEPVVVSASRVEQRLLDAPISTTVASGDALSTRAVAGLDDAIRYIPGITLNKYQVSVRNSSGFSQGAGSRVAMMIDGIPVLAGDTGEIKWDSLPTSAITQVEVVKGAGSSLYGSSALGGAINIVTDTPRSRNLKLWSKLGIYDEPYWKNWDWSDKLQSLKNLGFQWGDKLSSMAYLVTADITQSDGYREADDYVRSKCFAKLHWDISRNRALLAFVNIGYEDRASYLEWQSQNQALSSVVGRENDRVWSSKVMMAVKYRGDAPSKHLFFNTTIYDVFNNWDSKIYNVDTDTSEREYSKSNKFGADAQTMFTYGKLLFTVGGETNTDVNYSVTFGDHFGYGGALYSQIEASYLDPLILSGGIRADAFWADSAAVEWFNGISPKIAAVYHLNEQTALRTNISSGFRIPSMAELFTKTNAGGILRVQPNPDLLPEQGYTAEIGVNLIHDIFLIDGSLFYNYYYDMIEPTMLPGMVVEFQNLKNAQIAGGELCTKLSWKQWRLSANYLYTDSRGLDTTKTDLTTAQEMFPFLRKTDKRLPYRPDHSITLSAEWDFWKYATASADWRYKSKVDYESIYNADAKVEQKVLDAQIRLHYNRGAFTFRVNNVLNYNYLEIQRNVAPIRHYVISAEYNVL